MLITIKKRPKLLIGFGGYSTVPNIVVAIMCRTRIMLYEANAILGKANKFFLNYACCIATPYKDTIKIEEKHISKIYPISALIKQEHIIKKRKKNKKFTILVIGGSQGAKIFSNTVTKALQHLIKTRKLDISVIQQTKKEDITKVQKIYNELGISNQVESFFELGTIYAKTDLAIARSGASTVAELTINKIPAIFIPLVSKDNHQRHNITHIINSNSGWIIEENNDLEQKLVDKLIEILDNPKLLNKTVKNIEKIISQKKKSNISDILEKIIK